MCDYDDYVINKAIKKMIFGMMCREEINQPYVSGGGGGKYLDDSINNTARCAQKMAGERYKIGSKRYWKYVRKIIIKVYGKHTGPTCDEIFRDMEINRLKRTISSIQEDIINASKYAYWIDKNNVYKEIRRAKGQLKLLGVEFDD